jgi:transcriptional regulator with XRE-family HTH domain
MNRERKMSAEKTAPPQNVVGPMVRKYRLKAGLTQEELASSCRTLGLNLTRGTLAKIESQVRFIKACELYMIAQVLKIPLERFYPAGYGTAKR